MRNQFRSTAFITIKQNICHSKHPEHLEGCMKMMENATPILSPDELTILVEFWRDKNETIKLN